MLICIWKGVVSLFLFRNCLMLLLENQTDSLHYCYDVSYQCWFASEEAKIFCDNFNTSNAVVCSYLILAYTVRLAIINAVELERNDWILFLPLLRNVVLWSKTTSTKSLQIELVTKYDTKGAWKESLVGESKSANGGSKSAVTPVRDPICKLKSF